MKSITIDTSIDLAGLEKDLKTAEKKIKKLEDRLKDSQSKRDAVEDRMNELEYKDEYDPKTAEKLGKDYIKFDDAINQTNKDIARTREEAEAISQQIAENTPKTNAWSKATTKLNGVFGQVEHRMKMLAKRAIIFGASLKAMYAVRDYFKQAILQSDDAVASIGRLKGALQTMAQPIVNVLIPAFVSVVDWLTKIITAINMLIAKLSGKTLKQLAKDAQKTAKAGGKDKNGVASFDALNVLSSTQSGTGQIDAIENVAEMTNDELNGILVTLALIASALATLKLPTGVYGQLGTFVGVLGTIAGLAIAVKEYFKAWDEINISNLTGIIGGIALAMVSLYIAIGAVASGWIAIVGGIALVVLGFHDIEKNGASLINVLTTIGGLLMAGLGIAILTGSFIPLLLAGIASVILALTTVGGTTSDLVTNVKLILSGLIKFITGAFTGDWKKAWDGIKEIFRGVWNSLCAIVYGVVNAIIKAINHVIEKINDSRIADAVESFTGKSIRVPTIPLLDNIPYLAQGAVIPPNRQFLAVLGDQKQGTNIEAPASLIKQMVNESLSEYGGQEIKIIFGGSMAQLVRQMNPYIEKENNRRGSTLIVGGTR